jgi:hypothetical protein
MVDVCDHRQVREISEAFHGEVRFLRLVRWRLCDLLVHE